MVKDGGRNENADSRKEIEDSGSGRAARAAGLVSAAVMVSRILGLARETLFASLLGAGMRNDAFVVAFMVPNLFRDLFAEGALSSAFIPTFTEYLRRKTRGQAWHLANLVMSGLMVLLGAFALLLLIFSDQAVYLGGAGFGSDAAKAELTSALIRILSPFLFLVAVAAVAMGMLNALNHYFLPALAPAMFNLVVLVSGFTLAPYFQSRGIDVAYAMATGTLAGGAMQLAMQIPFLRKEGFRFRFRLSVNHEGIRRIAKIIAPAIIGVSAVQLNVVINYNLASFLDPGDGPVSWIRYAFRIIYLPIGLFGVAVGVVHLRNVSVSAAYQRWDELKSTVASSLKLVSMMAAPSMVGLIVLAVPVVRILFERGEFTASDTHFTAMALSVYALGLLGYSCMKVLVPTFYALQDTRTPVRISLLAVALNLSFNFVFVFLVLRQCAPRYAYLGLTLGTALSATLQILLLSRALVRRIGTMREFGVLPSVLKMCLSALVMGLAVTASRLGLEHLWPDPSFGGQLGALALNVIVGAVVYFTVCRLLGVREVSEFFSHLRSRLSKD